MKKRKHLNRAQRRKSEIQKAIEKLKGRAYCDGLQRGLELEHARCTQYVIPNDFGFIDLSRVVVNPDCPFVRVPAPAKPLLRIPEPGERLTLRVTHEFRAEPVEMRLANGAIARWYNWILLQ